MLDEALDRMKNVLIAPDSMNFLIEMFINDYGMEDVINTHPYHLFRAWSQWLQREDVQSRLRIASIPCNILFTFLPYSESPVKLSHRQILAYSFVKN